MKMCRFDLVEKKINNIRISSQQNENGGWFFWGIFKWWAGSRPWAILLVGEKYQQGQNIEHTSTAALMLAREGVAVLVPIISTSHKCK